MPRVVLAYARGPCRVVCPSCGRPWEAQVNRVLYGSPKPLGWLPVQKGEAVGEYDH